MLDFRVNSVVKYKKFLVVEYGHSTFSILIRRAFSS